MNLLLDAERIASRFEADKYVLDPVGWIHGKLGEFTWSKQREVAESVRDHRHTAVRSAHGTGKSFTASRLAAWWLDTHPVGSAFVVTTAPTQPQVEAILWREIRSAHRKGGLPGRLTLDCHWYLGDDELVAFGRKPADYSDPDKARQAFQGVHARYILVILDEAAGIPTWLWEAVESLATNDDARVLAIGNPDDPATEFEKCCRPGSGWNEIAISAFDLPAFTGEKVPDELHHVLTGKTWVEERRKRWGETSPLYISKVLGEFPEVSDDMLISPKMIREALERELDGIGIGRFGGDVARFGKDRSTLYRNRGGVLRKVVEMPYGDTMETAGQFAKALGGRKRVPIVIDADGLGAGTADRLREQGYAVIDFHGGQRAFEPDKFKNRRAEQYWHLREGFEDGLFDLDTEDQDLAAQLGNMKYKLDSSGRIQIEAKEDIVKRAGVSPDHADGAMMATFTGASMEDFEASNEQYGEESITGDLLTRPM